MFLILKTKKKTTMKIAAPDGQTTTTFPSKKAEKMTGTATAIGDAGEHG